MTTRADRAEELFRKGFNCSQAVFGAFCDVVGMDLDQALRASSAFGGGFGGNREVCGAVCGMTMLVGMLDGYSDPADAEERKRVYGTEKQLTARFLEKQDSLICRELLGLQPGQVLSEPPVRDEAYYASRPCLSAVRDAAQIVQEHYGIADLD